MTAQGTPSVQTVPLKRLGFVHSYAAYFTGLATSIYSTTKAHLPEQFGPTLKNFEDRASPYVTSAQDKSTSLLKGVDGQVDSVLTNGSSVVGDQKGFLRKLHADNVEKFSAEKKKISALVKDNVEWVKVHGLTGTLSVAVENGKDLYSKLFASISHSWEEASHYPIVTKASHSYLKLHDTLLGTPIYHQLFDIVSKTQERLYSYPAVKSISSNVDPYLAPVYKNTYYTAAKDHLKPVSTTKPTAATH